QMSVGRSAPGQVATGVLNLDAVPPAEAVEEVKKISDVRSVRIIELPNAGESPAWLQAYAGRQKWPGGGRSLARGPHISDEWRTPNDQCGEQSPQIALVIRASSFVIAPRYDAE